MSKPTLSHSKWLPFASVARKESPKQPTAAPPSRPRLIRLAMWSAAPVQPQPPPNPAPIASLPTSPIPLSTKTTISSSAAATPKRGPTTTLATNTQIPQSLPKANQQESNVIPPAEEKKTVFVQKSTTRVSDTHNPGKTSDLSKQKLVPFTIESKETEANTKRLDTVGSENRGALGKTHQNAEKIHVYESSNHKRPNGKRGHLFTNSDVREVTNSLMFESTCSSHDPGVHFSYGNSKLGGGGFHVNHGAKH